MARILAWMALGTALAAAAASGPADPAERTRPLASEDEAARLEEVEQADKEHGIIVEHLTHRLVSLASGTNAETPAEERRRAALAAEPILLQLEHAVRAHVGRLQAAHRRAASQRVRSRATSLAHRAQGILGGAAASNEACFACLYLMQKTLAETEPYYSPAVQAGTAAALSADARHTGTGARGIPIDRPMQSAYRQKNLPNNDPDPPNGAPLMAPPSGMNGWASPTTQLMFQGSAAHPVTNPWTQYSSREEETEEQEQEQGPRRLQSMDSEMWPRLHEANSPEEEAGGAGGSGEEEEGEEDEGGDEDEGGEEDEGGDEDEDEESFLQTAAAASATTPVTPTRGRRRVSPAAFLQARARARAAAGASVSAQAQAEHGTDAGTARTGTRTIPESTREDAPAEAYMLYKEPPAIGPRIRPPIEEGELSTDATKPLAFNKHFAAPLSSIDDGPSYEPPPLAPAALVRALENGAPASVVGRQSVQGTLASLGEAPGPMLVPRVGSDGKIVTDDHGMPVLDAPDVNEKSVPPFPKFTPDDTSSFLQAASRDRATDDATAPGDAASFLQAASRARAEPPSAVESAFPGSFFADVPESAYYMYAHPPAIGPNVAPPLPASPGRPTGAPVWGDRGAAPGRRAGDSPQSHDPAVVRDMGGSFSDELMNRSPDGGVVLQGPYPAGNMPLVGGFGDVNSKDMPVAAPAPVGGHGAGIVPGGRASLLQAAAGRHTPALMRAPFGPDADRLGMGPTVAQMNHLPLGKDEKPGPQAELTMAREPDLDFPDDHAQAAEALGRKWEVKGDALQVMKDDEASLLQRRGRAASKEEDSEEEDEEDETSTEDKSTEEEQGPGSLTSEGGVIRPHGSEPGVPKDLAAGVFTPESAEGGSLSVGEQRVVKRAIRADRTTISGTIDGVSEALGDAMDVDGLTGPSGNCAPDTVDGAGKRTGTGKCDAAGGQERVASNRGADEAFNKFAPSHGRSAANWPTTDGMPRSEGDRLPGVGSVKVSINQGSGKLMAGLAKAFKGKAKGGAYTVVAPSPAPHGVVGTDTGGGEVGSRFSDWNDPEAGLFDKPKCVTDEFNGAPTELDLAKVSSPADCYHTSALAHRMDQEIAPGEKMYGKPQYGKQSGLGKEFQRLIHPAKQLLPMMLQEAADARDGGAAGTHQREGVPAPVPGAEAAEAPASLLQETASGARGKASSRLKRAAARAAGWSPGAAAAAAEGADRAAVPAARFAGTRARAEAGAGAEASNAFRLRPMPHYCRRSDGGVCRQRLRAPSPWQMRRTFRRLMMQSRRFALAAKWRRALERMCSGVPAMGQARPPEMEGSGGWGGQPSGLKAKALGSKLMKNLDLFGAERPLGTKVVKDVPKDGLDGMLRHLDRRQESGYDGPKPPPRVQAEGLASNGKVEPQPNSGYVREPTPFGDHPAVGQLSDLGVPPLIAAHCSTLAGRLKEVAELYLHAYDMEETCTEIRMCKGQAFGITSASGATSPKARMFESMLS